MITYNNRRIFINENGQHFQIFSFVQEGDGSIYCTWPDFENTCWLICKESSEGIYALHTQLPGDGKFTVHGSGMTGFRKHQGKYDNNVIFRGNHLINSETGSLGIRHLFTAQIAKPYFIPSNSPYQNRKSDYLIVASELCPAILVFFAFPNRSFEFECNFSMHEDYVPWSIEGNPTHYLGTHVIELKTHSIVWLAYRTKDMFWPSNTHIFYDNGFKVPVVVGEGDKKYNMELRMPEYQSINSKISIKL